MAVIPPPPEGSEPVGPAIPPPPAGSVLVIPAPPPGAVPVSASDFTPPTPSTASGFVPYAPESLPTTVPTTNIGRNALADIHDIKTGTASLIAQALAAPYRAGKAVGQSLGEMTNGIPLTETSGFQGGARLAKDVGDAAVRIPGAVGGRVKELVTDPIGSFEKHPVFTALDLSLAGELAGMAARGGLEIGASAARAAGKPAVATKIADILATEPTYLPAGRASLEQKLSENPLIKVGQEGLIKASDASPVLKESLSMPGVRDIVPPAAISDEARQAIVAREVLRQARTDFNIGKSLKQDEIISRLKPLSEGELKAFIPVTEGRAVPIATSPEFKKAMDWYKSSVQTWEKAYDLPEETARRVAYQPLVLATKGTDEAAVKAIREVYAKAAGGDVRARRQVGVWNRQVDNARMASAEEAARSFLATNTGMKFNQAKRLAAEIAKETTPAPLYFPHVFEQKIKLSDFMPKTLLQRFKPNFLKARTGATGYIVDDPAKVLLYHEAQMEKFKMQESLIASIQEKFAEPLPKANALKPGYKVFAPDGYLKFFKVKMGLQDDFAKAVAQGLDVDDGFVRAAMNQVLPEVGTKDFISVGKPQLYQIPEAVANKLQAEMTPLNIFPAEIKPAVKLLYDKPLDAFKYVVLGSRPAWVVNNFAGNIITSMLKRVNLPQAFSRLSDSKFREAIAPAAREIEAGGFRRAEAQFMRGSQLRGGSALERSASAIGGLLDGSIQFADAPVAEAVRKSISYPIRAVKGGVEKMFEINSRIEDAFRKATYLDAASKQVAKEAAAKIRDSQGLLDRLVGRTPTITEEQLLKGVEKLSANPESRRALIGQVNDALNDYSRLGNFERQVLRRAMPFWSWWKFMNVFAIKLAVKDPQMAVLVKELAKVGNDIEDKEWKSAGLDVREVPIWRRGAAVVGSDREKVTALSGMASNPLNVVGEYPGIAPALQLGLERMTGRHLLTGSPFTAPNVRETQSGKQVEYDPKTKTARELSSPPTPPLLSQILRTFFPIVSDAEMMAYPYKRYDTAGLFERTPRVDARGRAMEAKPGLRLSAILGIPEFELERRMLRRGLAEMKQAPAQIRRTLKRIEKAKEKTK